MPRAGAATRKVRMRLDQLVDNPRNPKDHPVHQLEQLAASYRRFGQPRAILARTENRMIIAGHGLKAAMLRAGAVEADVILWNVDQKTADAYLLADNRLAELSPTNDDRLREVLSEIDAKDYSAIGFLPEEVQQLLTAHGEDDMLAVTEIETGEVADTFWIGVEGPLRQQAAVLHRIRQLMAEFPDVEVELGTTPI